MTEKVIKLHEMEVLTYSEVSTKNKKRPVFFRTAVPGGWLYERTRWRVEGEDFHMTLLTSTFVPDPDAPHCKALAVQDQLSTNTKAFSPPQEDLGLRDFMLKLLGDPVITPTLWERWTLHDVTITYDPTGNSMDCPWRIGLQGQWLSASLAGPMIWALHQWGTT